jgi:pimeloyl-ACP methyl ester carboxylesterase
MSFSTNCLYGLPVWTPTPAQYRTAIGKEASVGRTQQPPVLAIWGRNDPFFLPAGAQAFKADIPGADVRLLDTGHFALETHAVEIAQAIRDFLHSP